LPHIFLFQGGIVIETIFPVIAGPELTTAETSKAWHHLSDTRDLLLESVSGLSSSQWNFKTDSETWSIAETMEHLVIIETRVHAIIRNMSNAPEAASGSKQCEMDEFILKEVPKRSIKVKAPIPVCPANRWSGGEALQQFIEGREQTIQLLGAPLLRGRVMPHPLFGPWDGYQWLLAVASHSARHTDQIREVKNEPGFPAVSAIASVPPPH
jgi:DinB superfamily